MNRTLLGVFFAAIGTLSCVSPSGISLCSDSLADDAVPGIEVGAKAPGFSLKDQNGKSQNLTDLVKPGKSVALVFYRSADW